MRTRLAALAAIFLTAHLVFLSPTLEDIDSVNFALGVRDFDVGQHQPHPPGSPVFIALAKGSTAVFRAIGIPGAESRALAFWSALGGALMLPLLAMLFEAIDGDRRRAFWAAVLGGLAPLAWFTASRPMSDVAGLAAAIAAQTLVLRGWMKGTPRELLAGALVAGVAAGIRIQTAALTVPVLAAAILLAPRTVSVGTRLLTIAAALGGVILWGVPLLIASGGPTSYLAALGTQAGEDFVGVVMLWTSPTPRVAFHAIVNAFVWPWGRLAFGTIVVVVAAIGALITAVRAPRHLALLVLVFGPYAVFHLLLQETLTMRYALPLVPAVAYLFVRAAQSLRLSPFLELAAVAVSLVIAVPQATAFAAGSPGFAAMTEAVRGERPIAGHAGMRRLHEWFALRGQTRARFMRAPHGFEWLTLVEEWRRNPDSRIQFLANPKRTDYRALLDPHARTTAKSYRWPFPDWPLLGGARPGTVERIEFSPPGWMLDRGWAVTAEVAGTTEKEGYGPHRRPSVAWVRGRDMAATLMIGGRHLGASDEPPARITLTFNGAPLEQWTVSPGFFLRTIDIPAGRLAGTNYLPLSATATSESGDTRLRVGLEQFDLQPPGNVMLGVMEGWHEPEYNRTTGRAWRWASERAVLWIRPVGRDVTLTIEGESPLRYFDAAPALRVSAAGRELSRLSPADDFRWDVVIPASVLDAARGGVALESDKWFVPAEREGAADRRRLALRIYQLSVR